jgi:hypothetical protein
MDCVVVTGVDLLPGERVVWQGRPTGRPLFRLVDVALVPLSVMWCMVAGGWDVLVVRDREQPPVFLRLWAVVFVLVGLCLLIGRFVVRSRVSRRTRYVVTDRRLLVIAGWSGTRIRSVLLMALPAPRLARRPDGSGDLTFVLSTARAPSGRLYLWDLLEPSDTLVLRQIPHVRRVNDLIVAQIAARQSGQERPATA